MQYAAGQKINTYSTKNSEAVLEPVTSFLIFFNFDVERLDVLVTGGVEGDKNLLTTFSRGVQHSSKSAWYFVFY